MPGRTLTAAKVLSAIVIGGALSWVLSWFIQYICSITVTGATLHITSQPTNRLAAVTALATFVLAICWWLLVEVLGGCMLFFVICFAGGSIVAAVSWLAARVFTDTPVSTPGARIVYGVVIAVWSFAAYYVLLASPKPASDQDDADAEDDEDDEQVGEWA